MAWPHWAAAIKEAQTRKRGLRGQTLRKRFGPKGVNFHLRTPVETMARACWMQLTKMGARSGSRLQNLLNVLDGVCSFGTSTRMW